MKHFRPSLHCLGDKVVLDERQLELKPLTLCVIATHEEITQEKLHCLRLQGSETHEEGWFSTQLINQEGIDPLPLVNERHLKKYSLAKKKKQIHLACPFVPL